MNLNQEQSSVLDQFESFLSNLGIRDGTCITYNADHPPPVFTIGGFAGTGKTTMLREVVARARAHLEKHSDDEEPVGEVRAAAPTNKAAKRLRAKMGGKVTTLHYLLGATPKMYLTSNIPSLTQRSQELAAIPNPSEGETKTLKNILGILDVLGSIRVMEDRLIEIESADPPNVAEEQRLANEIQALQEKMLDFPMGGGGVTINDIVVCDESSMVSVELRDKIYGLNPLAVVWVGDPGQLEPVKSKCWFAPAPQTTLKQIMRQDSGSGIVLLSSLIRQHQTTDTHWLSQQLKGYSDVEFIFERKGDIVDWEYLADQYGDRWLTWRNGFKTRNHQYHTRRLNAIFRHTLGFESPYPQPGDLLYVTSRFHNGCKRQKDRGVYLSKGDELRVNVAGSINPSMASMLTLNQSPSTYQGFDTVRMTALHKRKIEEEGGGVPEGCICNELVDQMDDEGDRSASLVYCNAIGAKSRGFIHDTCAPWVKIGLQTHAIHAGLTTIEENGMKPTSFYSLINPSDLLWDEGQRTDLWRTDQYYIREAGGDVVKSMSPLKSILQASYGYCISVHQSQGSEWDRVCLYWDGVMSRFDPTNAVKFLYTAVTRASKRLCIVTI